MPLLESVTACVEEPELLSSSANSFYRVGTGCHSVANSSIDPDRMTRIVPLVAMYAGKREVFEVAEDCITLMQECDIVVASTLLVCRLLAMIILANGNAITMETFLEGVVNELQDANREHSHPLDLALAEHLKDVMKADQSMSPLQACQLFGMACGAQTHTHTHTHKHTCAYVHAMYYSVTHTADSSSPPLLPSCPAPSSPNRPTCQPQVHPLPLPQRR